MREEVDPMDLYFREGRTYPNLTRDDEHNYFVLYKENQDERARNILILSNLRLVGSFAFRYKHNCLEYSLSDLMQDGLIGLVKAVDNFDFHKENRLSSYAKWHIKNEIGKGIKRSLTKRVKIPSNSLTVLIRLSKIGELSLENFSEITGLERRTAEKAYNIFLEKPLYLDDTGNGYEENNYKIVGDMTQVNPYKCLEKVEMNETLKKLIEKLTEKERDFLERRHGLNGFRVHTFRELSEIYDYGCPQSCMNVNNRILEKLRKSFLENVD